MTHDHGPAPSGAYTAPAVVPTPVRVARVLLVVTAAVSVVTVVAFLSVAGLDPATVGLAVWTLVPAGLALLLAGRLGYDRPRVLWAVVALEVFFVLQALVRVADGDPQGLTNLLLPVAVIVCVTRPSARAYLRGR
ncbi:hypothetical protein [Jannaschia sp. R86511]|uniref:hypothetical protein n=1 Tax=Jannaschia sp. R86511 TaxID=3093853 RepID=UPI0036D39A18